ncbi:sugar phosphate isomerase/epimerase family protein [Parasphingorhabdus pacifica]
MPADPLPHRLSGIGDEAAVDLTGQIAAVTDLGWSAIELRTVDRTPLGDLDSRRFGRIVRAIREAGVDVVCLASRIGNWSRPVTAPFADDLYELDILAEQCEVLGTRFVRIMSYPNDGLPETEWRDRVLDRIARLAERAAQHDVVLLHENCSGWAGTNADRMLQLITEAGGASLRLLFDTGNGIEHRYDAIDLLPSLLPHVAHVHVKDAVRSSEGVRYVLPGEGRARVSDCLRLLREHGYTGAFSLEPHLSTRPHDGVCADTSAAELFMRAGRSLERLLGDTETTTAPRVPATAAPSHETP